MLNVPMNLNMVKYSLIANDKCIYKYSVSKCLSMQAHTHTHICQIESKSEWMIFIAQGKWLQIHLEKKKTQLNNRKKKQHEVNQDLYFASAHLHYIII